jgi:hypothetical protein
MKGAAGSDGFPNPSYQRLQGSLYICPGVPVSFYSLPVFPFDSMWTPSFPAFISLAEGFLARFQQPWNISGSVAPVIKLPQSQYDEFVPYIQFTRAAYCDPSKIVEWSCGG